MPKTYSFEIFADYFQFYLQDEAAAADYSASMDDAAFANLLAVAEGVIVVLTARNMTVPVTLSIHKAEPPIDLACWDRVNLCSIAVSSGRLVIAGCTDYLPDASRIEVDPGTYRARVSYGELSSLSDDGLEGDDHYHIELWPAEPCAVSVLKG